MVAQELQDQWVSTIGVPQQDHLREKVVFTAGLLQMEAPLGSGTKGTLRDIEEGHSCFKDACLSVSVCFLIFSQVPVVRSK